MGKKCHYENDIINLCYKAFFDKTCITVEELPKAELLEEFFSYAAIQGVLSPIVNLLENAAIPDLATRLTIIKWYGVVEKTKTDYLIRVRIMEQLASIFNKAGLDVMFLKGATLAQMYPRPELRVFSDVDIYLYGKSNEGTVALENAGIKSKDWAHHHTHAVINGILVENHYDFLDRRNHRCNLLLDDELKSLAAGEGHRIHFRFENRDIDNAYCMSPTMNAIFLMRHMSAHFVSETISLRMLFDWVLFLKNFSKDVDWELVLKLYEKSGMMDFAKMIQNIILVKLRLQIDECKIEPFDDNLCERIWQSILFVPERNPYKAETIKYLLFETKVFFQNRWKHRIVFPDESYFMLFIKIVGSNIRIIKKK